MNRSTYSAGTARTPVPVRPSAWVPGIGLILSVMLGSGPLPAQVAPTNEAQVAPADPDSTDPKAVAVEPPPFQIVVHRNNPIDNLPVKALSRIFLKKTKRWDDDLWPGEVRVVPLDLEEKSEIRKKFTRAIHDKSTGAIKSYWQREIFSGREVPPTEVESDEEMMKRVADEEGAIGYVSGTAALPDELKVLEVADE